MDGVLIIIIIIIILKNLFEATSNFHYIYINNEIMVVTAVTLQTDGLLILSNVFFMNIFMDTEH
jgi:hypothetical protein